MWLFFSQCFVNDFVPGVYKRRKAIRRGKEKEKGVETKGENEGERKEKGRRKEGEKMKKNKEKEEKKKMKKCLSISMSQCFNAPQW